MTEHRVRIGTLGTELRTLGSGAQRSEQLGRELCEAVPRLLPQLLEEALQGREGIIRIRSLRVELPAAGASGSSGLAAQLCAAITRSLAQALTGSSPRVAYWPRRTEYLADYLAFRHALRPGAAWQFEEFTALERLDPGQAVIELAGREPAVLSALAIAGTGSTILERLDSGQYRQLLAALLQSPQGRPRIPHLPAGRADLAVRGTDPGTLARQTLQLLLAALAGEPAPDAAAPAELLPASMALVALGVLLHRQQDAPASAALQDSELFDRHLREVARLPSAYRRALEQAGRDPRLRHLLQQHLRRVRDEQAQPQAGTPSTQPPGAQNHTAPEVYFSRYAGVGLLLPVATGLGLERQLDPEQLWLAAVAALGTDVAEDAARDPLIRRIFGAPRTVGSEPRPAPWPLIQERMRQAVDPDTLPLLAEPGAAGWTGVLLAGFASRLPGLRHSSAAYLRRQFLIVPGQLQLAEHTVQLTLQGPDLAVVLSMAGLQGPQQPIPWLHDRVLHLELTGLRP